MIFYFLIGCALNENYPHISFCLMVNGVLLRGVLSANLILKKFIEKRGVLWPEEGEVTVVDVAVLAVGLNPC